MTSLGMTLTGHVTGQIVLSSAMGMGQMFWVLEDGGGEGRGRVFSLDVQYFHICL